MRKLWIGFVLCGLLWLCPGLAAAQGKAVEGVVATTSWTAALASAAGIARLQTLAPATLQDPAAYQLSNKDLDTLRKARWVIYTGDEAFAGAVVQAAPQATLIQVQTGNTPEIMVRETTKIAATIGTSEAQRAWQQSFEGIASRIQADIHALYDAGTPVVAHPSQLGFAHWLGWEVAGELNPDGLSPEETQALADAGPLLVLDSAQRPVGPLVAEKAGVLYAALLDYPGPKGASSLEEMLRHNRDQIAPYLPARGELTEAASLTTRLVPYMIGGGSLSLLVAVCALVYLRRLNRPTAPPTRR